MYQRKVPSRMSGHQIRLESQSYISVQLDFFALFFRPSLHVKMAGHSSRLSRGPISLDDDHDEPNRCVGSLSRSNYSAEIAFYAFLACLSAIGFINIVSSYHLLPSTIKFGNQDSDIDETHGFASLEILAVLVQIPSYSRDM